MALHQAWDTHVHVFDHEDIPFKPNRVYTPQSVSLRDVVEANNRYNNFVLVQASFEDGAKSVLKNLRQARDEFPDREFRAEIFWDAHATSTYDIDELHRLGVRCLRLHAEYGNGSTSLDWLIESFRDLCKVARRHRWAVAAQLPMAAWLQIGPHLGLGEAPEMASASDPLRDVSVPIIAEHFGSPPLLPLTGAQWATFRTFVDLLRNSPRLFVKLSGLHRRVSSSATIDQLAPLVGALAKSAPRRLVYGSDFPHVDVDTASMIPTPFLHVDHHHEASVLQSAMSVEDWHYCLVENPRSIFQ